MTDAEWSNASSLATVLPANGNQSGSSSSILQLSDFLKSNFTPPIIVLGILGNVLNLVTLLHVSPASVTCCAARKGNQQTAAMSLLVCMSAADLFVLLAQVPGLANPPTHERRFYECYLRSWLSNFGLTAVALFGACIAVERYAAVRNRERLASFFREHVALLVAGVSVFAAVVHIPRFFERQPVTDATKQQECTYTAYQRTTTYQVLWYVTVLVNSVLPLLVMVAFASVVARTLMRIEQQHKSMRMSSASRTEERVALATRLMAVSIVVFAVCSIGGIITVLIISFRASHLLQEPAFRLFATVNNLLASLKSSVNFALYCTTSAVYRHTLRNIVLCRRTLLNSHRSSAKPSSFDGRSKRALSNAAAIATKEAQATSCLLNETA